MVVKITNGLLLKQMLNLEFEFTTYDKRVIDQARRVVTLVEDKTARDTASN